MVDSLAPVIVANQNDSDNAKIFTLIHELAHIWLGKSGVSNMEPTITSNEEDNIEVLCNRIAAECLVPTEALKSNWSQDSTLEILAPKLAKMFKVSPLVLARRALELKFISQNQLTTFYKQMRLAWEKNPPTKKKSKEGGDFYRTLPIYNSRLFTQSVLSAAFEGKLLLREAGRLLNLAPSKLQKLAASINDRKT